MAIRCPNCGEVARRLLSDRLPNSDQCPARQVMLAECLTCDYFISMCWQDDKVLEAYAPGMEKPSCDINRWSLEVGTTPLNFPPMLPLTR